MAIVLGSLGGEPSQSIMLAGGTLGQMWLWHAMACSIGRRQSTIWESDVGQVLQCCVWQRGWSESRAMQWKRVGEKDKKEKDQTDQGRSKGISWTSCHEVRMQGAVVVSRGAREGLRGGASHGSSVGGWGEAHKQRGCQTWVQGNGTGSAPVDGKTFLRCQHGWHDQILI